MHSNFYSSLWLVPYVALTSCFGLVRGQSSCDDSISVAVFATMGTAIACFLLFLALYMWWRREWAKYRRGKGYEQDRKPSITEHLPESQREKTLHLVTKQEKVLVDAGTQTDAEKTPPVVPVVEEVGFVHVAPLTSSLRHRSAQLLPPTVPPGSHPTSSEEALGVGAHHEELDIARHNDDDDNAAPLIARASSSSTSSHTSVVEELYSTSSQKHPAPLVRRKSRDEIAFRSGWRKTVRLTDLIRAKLIEESRVIQLESELITIDEVERELRPYLIGQYPIAGVYNDRIGGKMSLYTAFKQRIISRGTALSLLEAQAAVGSIIDPISGDKMSVDEALERQLLDRSFAAVLARAERAVLGYQAKGTTEKLSLFQAMQKGYIVEKHGIRLLEAQIATGGIIDPVANHRLPVDVAFERGLFDERINKILQDPGDDTKGFLDPNTNENLTYLELIDRCVEDEDTTLLLLPLVKEEETKLYKARELSRETLQRRISRNSSRGASTSSEP